MYRLTDSTNIVRITDNAYIPVDLANTDYQQYLVWLSEGNVPDPYAPPPTPIPTTVTRFQALAVLAAGGYLPTVRAYIATLDEDNIQRLAWENAADWERTSPTLNALAAMLGLDDTQVDDLFIAASNISA